MVDVLKGVLDQHIQNSIIKLQIWDDQFLKLTRSIVEPEHFTAPETELIVRVIYKYFDEFKEAPKHHYRHLMQIELDKRKAPDAEIEKINTDLTSASKKVSEVNSKIEKYGDVGRAIAEVINKYESIGIPRKDLKRLMRYVYGRSAMEGIDQHIALEENKIIDACVPCAN